VAAAFHLALALVLVAAPLAEAQAAESVAVLLSGRADASGPEAILSGWAERRALPVLREAVASTPVPSVRARMEGARIAYRALQIPDALQALEAVAVEAAASGAAGLGRGDLVDAALLGAACHLLHGDETAAWDGALAAVALAPDRPLDPAAWPPRLVAEVKRAEVASVATSAVFWAVSVLPADAELFVDGEPAGRGASTLRLRPGRHYVRAERAGFAPAGHAVALAPGRSEDALQLVPLAPPTPRALWARATVGGARRALAAWVSAGADGEPLFHLALVDEQGLGAEATVPIGPGLVPAEIEAAADRLLPVKTVAFRAPRPIDTDGPRRRRLAWGLGLGIGAAAILAVGLGVGLGLGGPGFNAHVDLGPAR